MFDEDYSDEDYCYDPDRDSIERLARHRWFEHEIPDRFGCVGELPTVNALPNEESD